MGCCLGSFVVGSPSATGGSKSGRSVSFSFSRWWLLVLVLQKKQAEPTPQKEFGEGFCPKSCCVVATSESESSIAKSSLT